LGKVKFRAAGCLLWRPHVFQQTVLLSLDLPESVPQFAANRLGNLQQDATVLGQREESELLAIVDRHHFQRRRQQLPSAL